MVSRAKSSVVAACLALVLGAVIGSSAVFGSVAARLAQDDPAPLVDPARSAIQPGPRNQPPANEVDPDFQPVDHPSEMDFVPIAPCRLVDTRVAGGTLSAGSDRGFKARGTSSFAGQGGSATGCSVAANAAAISMTVVAVKPAQGGYLRGWAHATTEPLSSFMNVTKNVTLAGFTNQDLAVPGLPSDFRVRNGAGKLHLVIDVSGYYIAPMAAYVAANGTLTRRSRALSVDKGGAGIYTVTFDRDVSKCHYTATGSVALGSVVVEPQPLEPDTVFVARTGFDGLLADGAFYLTVTC